MAQILEAFEAELAACRADQARLLDLVVQRATDLVGEGSILFILGDDGETLEPRAFAAKNPGVVGALGRAAAAGPFRIGDGLLAQAMRAGTAVMLDPSQTRAIVFWRDRLRVVVHALALVPLVAYGEVLGILAVGRIDDPTPYSTEARIALEALAQRAALALGEPRRATLLTSSDYHALFQHSADGMLLSVPDGSVIAANPAACAILGLTEREVCAMDRRDMMVDDERTRAALAQRALTGTVRAEVTMRRGDGSTFVADASSTVFRTEEDEVRACIVFRDISEQVALRESLVAQRELLQRMAREDVLTGLRNRRAFFDDARQTCALADREGARVQLVYFDVDGLKAVNDRDGHEVGDTVLVRFATALAGATRAGDVTARLGGDEFVALLFGASERDALRTVDRVVDAARLAETAERVGVSHGVVERTPNGGVTLEELLHEADRRMYAHKARARGGAA
jgi:diguanylate cyclase (GGDEF)-like protein/PAS domain S-box-containing protein